MREMVLYGPYDVVTKDITSKYLPKHIESQLIFVTNYWKQPMSLCGQIIKNKNMQNSDKSLTMCKCNVWFMTRNIKYLWKVYEPVTEQDVWEI
jgi:hypothetical protein